MSSVLIAVTRIVEIIYSSKIHTKVFMISKTIRYEGAFDIDNLFIDDQHSLAFPIAFWVVIDLLQALEVIFIVFTLIRVPSLYNRLLTAFKRGKFLATIKMTIKVHQHMRLPGRSNEKMYFR